MIDEYDNPLIEAYKNNYYDKAIKFYQTWLTGALKNNKDVFLAVISGVLKIGQESLFSKLNNLEHVPLKNWFYNVKSKLF